MGVPFSNASPTAPNGVNYSEHIFVLDKYCEYVGWKLENTQIPRDAIMNDEKIAILMITPMGDIVKDVGIRVSEEQFYVMRE
jgi:hypothetical protein